MSKEQFELLLCKRDTNIPKLYNILSRCTNIYETIKLCFHIRDCRGGKGERKIGRYCFIWLFINYPKEFTNFVHLIPYYGRWDDIFCLFMKLDSIEYINANYISNVKNLDLLKFYQKKIIFMVINQLKIDLKHGYNSLCAKWFPNGDIFNMIAKMMKISRKKLRTKYITPLRKNLLENNLHKHNIPYSCMPKGSIKKYSNFFWKHDKVNFLKWKETMIRYIPNIENINMKDSYIWEQLIKQSNGK
jgi:hypothetical protein